MNLKDMVANNDMVYLKHSELKSVESWLRTFVDSEYATEIDEEDTINGQLLLKFFQDAFYEQTPFRKITIVLIDSNELDMEIEACEDVVVNNGDIEKLKDSTLSFLINMTAHISMSLLQQKLGIKPNLARCYLKNVSSKN